VGGGIAQGLSLPPRKEELMFGEMLGLIAFFTLWLGLGSLIDWIVQVRKRSYVMSPSGRRFCFCVDCGGMHDHGFGLRRYFYKRCIVCRGIRRGL